MSRLPIASLIIAVSAGCSAIIDRSLDGSRGLLSIADQQLSFAYGADKTQSVKQVGECDSNYIKNNSYTAQPCDGCNATNSTSSPAATCFCCDGSGEIDMALIDQNQKFQTVGIDPNSNKSVNCGNANVSTCQADPKNGGYSCLGASPSGRSCGAVTQYSNQQF